ncbi:MAG: acyltransferase family protein [Mycobacterium sp.]|nr:acyltransferase family protein [Mycobacterium sp.]
MCPTPVGRRRQRRWVAPVPRRRRPETWSRSAGVRARRRPGIPALDGLRALAVALVLADHGGIPGMGGGFIGVDVFFVLSGFLITSLLLDELCCNGRIDLPGFWIRRARRLLPALVLMVLAVGGARELLPQDTVAGLRGDAIAAFFWVANWRFVTQQTDYFAQGATPSPLQHTWSLAVEEQYYFVWPLLLIAVAVLLAANAKRRGAWATLGSVRFVVFLLATVGTLASAGAAVVLASHAARDRVYFGTDTRAQALLTGAAVAALLVQDWSALNRGWSLIRSRWGRLAARVLPVLGLGTLAWAAHRATGSTSEFHDGLLAAVEVAAVAVIASVALDQRGAVARVLACRPLVWLGTISYGVYLWHWPIFMVVNGELTGWSGLPLFVLRCLATVVVAAGSWWLIEQPIRRWRPLRVPLLPLAGATVAAAVAVTMMVVPVGTAPRAAQESSLPPGVAGVAAVSPSPPDNAVPAQAVVRRDPNRPFTVSVFGDSIAWTLMHYLPATPGFNFVDHTVIGCSLVRGGPYRYLGQTLEPKAECDTWPSRWSEEIAQDRPDVALLIIGRWETVDRVNEGSWTHIGDPSFDEYLTGELNRALDVLGATGSRLVVATVPYSRRGEKPDGSPWPEDQPGRVDQWNTLLRRTIGQRPNVGILDLNKKLCPGGSYTAKVDGVQVRSDGVHLTAEGVEWLTPWLEESVR